MTTKKRTPEIPMEDDYYVWSRQAVMEETKKANRIHEEDVRLHLNASIPYYEDAPEEIQKVLV
jgi:hypothetical protein